MGTSTIMKTLLGRDQYEWARWIISTLVIGMIACLWTSVAHASEVPTGEVGGYNVERLADAIYKAEGGAKTRHPYGILQKYKHTTPRQACINTIRSKHREWVRLGSKGDYLVYLASRYAPIGVANDPTNLNKNWLNNVKKLY